MPFLGGDVVRVWGFHFALRQVCCQQLVQGVLRITESALPFRS